MLHWAFYLQRILKMTRSEQKQVGQLINASVPTLRRRRPPGIAFEWLSFAYARCAEFWIDRIEGGSGAALVVFKIRLQLSFPSI